MQKKFGWDDGRTIALFDRFHPDVVCGEVYIYWLVEELGRLEGVSIRFPLG